MSPAIRNMLIFRRMPGSARTEQGFLHHRRGTIAIPCRHPTPSRPMATKNILTRSLRKQADAMLRENRHAEAAGLYARICKADRKDMDARALLAISLIQTGRLDEAEAECRQALQLDPRHALTRHALGTALERQGRLREAVPEFTRATELRPDFANAHFFRANALAELGETAAAEAAYREALRLEPGFAGAMAGLGRLHTQTGNPEAGEEWLRRALQVEPANTGYMTALAGSLTARGRQAEALPILQQALQTEPDSAPAHYALGAALATLGRYDEAITHYRRACELQPEDEYASGALAGLLERRGEFAQASTLLKPFIDTGRGGAGIALPFADVARHFGRESEAVAVLERALTDPSLDRKTRIEIHFRLGKLLDAAEDFDRAFASYHTANRLGHALDDRLAGDDAVDRQAERLLQQLETLDADFWRDLPKAGNRSPLPVFIVGMPRSGTTLLEQILASHPDVHGAGELAGVESIARSLGVYSTGYPECLRGLTETTLSRHANSHLQQLQSFAPQASRVVDKLPHNFLHLGLISLLFPGAQVIHVARDPRDTCLSIYFQIFSPQHAYASNLARLGLHYRIYERLMRYWNEALDLQILNIRYEELLQHPEQTIHSLTDFCSLPRDEKCLCFYETRRDVNTPSYDQVRQPLYSRSAGRWKHYATHLDELNSALTPDDPEP